ncbi:MAG: efflux RND transporter periplasmic adaptor subunit [Desulfobacteraceae bacterium]|nr:efflux RND transporter periplasmic adaptor subunit [Desulfobacteraceae bacterium]MBC2755453.1 efflux RND transporter periplasmic adaptor subunit [Desulfobacteraceae bacterium]
MADKVKKSAERSRSLLKFIWGAIPVIVLLLIIVLLSGAIGSKIDKLEAVKTGIADLQGVKLAINDIDVVVKIITSAKDAGEAVDQLSDALNITSDQAKAILHQPVGALVKSSQKKLDKQIAFLEKQIAENKIDMQDPVPDVNVVALELTKQPIRDRINLPGIVEPWVKFNIIAEVRGKVMEKRIKKGTPINAGDIIAVLDTKDYEIAFQAAKASYDTAFASKKRLDKLYKEQLTSRSQLDDITAQVEQYKAQLDNAALNLERCIIRSPISGIINNLYIDKGQYVKVSDPVGEVLQMDKIKVIVGIPESDVSAVNHVSSFEVELDALNGKVFKAKKYFLSRASDPQARLYNLELAIDNPSGEILPDMFARVDIVKQEVADSLSVPLYSIITLNNEQVVYVVNDYTVHARSVKTGIQEGWRIEITNGLDAGDHVIIIGHRNVSDGQTVNVVQTVSSMEELLN